MDKVAVVNLGCPKNQIDAETMLGFLIEAGYEITHQPQMAEIIIVNTCGFIDKARQESIEQILAMAEYKEKGHCRQLIVTGCLSQRYYDELRHELPEVDGFLGTGNVDKILTVVSDSSSFIGAPELYDGKAEVQRLYSTYPYGYLKIAEGCNNWCSYCIIPQLRGKLRSKPQAQILTEAQRMAQGGLRELVLIAQDTSQYGLDFSGRSQLPGLLQELDAIEEIGWLRLLYCYPDHINEALVSVLKNSLKICNYLDIPLQHSHPDILMSMGRNRGGMRSWELIDFLRSHIPDIALRTTFIVGYPGETEEHFQHLLEFVRWAKFDQLGAFAYSREEGTRAAGIKEQVPARVAARRYHELMQTQQQIVLNRSSEQIGKEFKVLIDGIEDGQAHARNYQQAPEVDGTVLFASGKHKAGDFVRIKCTGIKGYDLVGVAIDGRYC